MESSTSASDTTASPGTHTVLGMAGEQGDHGKHKLRGKEQVRLKIQSQPHPSFLSSASDLPQPRTLVSESGWLAQDVAYC
jgi:hypothetical protein